MSAQILRLIAVGGEDAGDAGEVVGHAIAGPSGVYGEHGPDAFRLAVAEFDDERAAGAQEFGCLGDELRVQVEAVFAGEERLVRLVPDDLALQTRLVGAGDVGRIADDGVEDCSAIPADSSGAW
jgi:hypothetical protein